MEIHIRQPALLCVLHAPRDNRHGCLPAGTGQSSRVLFTALGELGMSKLFYAAGSISSLVLLLSGCGPERVDLSARSSEDLSTLMPSSPAQGQVVTSGTVVFSGRTTAPSGSAASVSATDGRLVVHTCSATVRNDQTFSCSQKLADGGYTWTARIASQGSTSAGI